jgi:hypothetical protein
MKKLSSALCVVAMLTMGCSLNAKVSNAGHTGQAYQWYDGDKQRTVYLDATMIADFNPQSDASAKAAKSNGMSVSKTVGGARLWMLTSGTKKSALDSVKAKNVSGAYSPVFRTSQAGNQLSALPGKVIVQFASDWDEDKIKQWVSDQGQTIDSKASFGTSFYILATPPGLASLEIANRLYETGEVLLASPNWWKEVHKK